MNRIKKIVTLMAAFGCFLAFAPKGFSQQLPEWVKTLKISGDFGARTEYISDEKTLNHYDRVRERARIRLSLDSTPVNKLKVSFGIETSGTNPTSAWTDFTDFRNQPLYIAHAYMEYEASDKLTVSGGKLKSDVPFWKPVQLIWKNDVNPYGVSANARVNIIKNFDFFLNGGIFALTEYYDYGIGVDTPMNAIAVVQPGVEYKRWKLRAKGAFSVQQFSLVNHDTSGNTWIRSNNSFTLLAPSWDVSCVNLLGSYGPMFSGEYSKNIHKDEALTSPMESLQDAQPVKKPKAYMLQAGFGSERVNRFKAWQVKAAYRRRELNSIPYGFGQTSAYNADPGKGWEYFAAFGLMRNVAFNATIYRMTDLEGKLPQSVSQFDVIARF